MIGLLNLISQPRSRAFRFSVVALFGLHIVALSLFAIYRFVDWDEGFYLQAGRSVANGLRLYSDFFHPQAPLYPQFLALLPGSGWDYWLQARFASVLFSVLTMALVGLSVKRILVLSAESAESDSRRNATQGYFPILLALALYSISGLFLAWNSVAKPLALSQFLLMAGVFSRLLAHKQETARRWFWILISGVSLTFAAQTRSALLVAWLITLLSAFAGANLKRRTLTATLFLTGSVLAAIPSIIMALRDSSRFFFNNFGFHLARTEPPGPAEILADKLNFLSRTIPDPQLAILLLLTIIILLNRSRLRSGKVFPRVLYYYPLAVGVAIIGAYFMAFPSHRQYVTQGLPLLIVFVAAHSGALLQGLQKNTARYRRSAPALIATIYLLGVLPYCWVYFTAARARDQRCLQSRVTEIVSVIKRYSASSDTILAELPIYAVLANRKQVRRAEFVGFEYKSLALGAKYARMNLADSAYITNLVTSQRVKLVVVENVPDAGLAEALRGNYEKLYDDSFSQVWVVKLE